MPQKPSDSKAVGRARRARPQPTTPYEDTVTPRKAVIYIRVSREEQAQGHSLEAQERECREFLEREKPTWTVVGVFQDEHSGKTDSRPGFKKMLNMIYEGKADAIVAHRLDRFSRNLHHILVYFKELEAMNVVMAFAKDRFDFSTSEGRLQFHILAVFADWYIQNLAREVRKGKRSRVLKGLHNNQLPFGYVPGEEGIGEIVPEEADWIRRAYELYATGQYSDSQVADFLNDAGVKTRRGRNWTKDGVRELLQNEFYLGLVKYRGDLYPGEHEAIIPQELFDQVQQVRLERYRRPRVYSPTIQVYLLSGLGRCAHCGRTLRAQGGRYRYYREMSKIRGYTDCPVAGYSIRMDKAEEQLEQLMCAFRLPPGWQEEIRAYLEDEDEIQAIVDERAKLEEKLRRIGDLYADGIYSRTTYEGYRNEIQRKLELLVIPDPAGVIDAGYHLETLSDAWPHLTPGERRELCQLMLKAVYIDMEQERIVRIVPDEDFLLLFQYNPYLEPGQEGDYLVHLPEVALAA